MKQEYVEISCAGMGSVIVELNEVEDFISIEVENGEPRTNFSVNSVFMTKAEFEALPEFEGF